MKFPRVIPLFVAAVLFLSHATPIALVQQPSMPGYPAAGGAPIVTFQAPGNAPRAPLRYKIAAGQKGTMDLTMAMSMTMNMGTMSTPADLPTMKISASVDVISVDANGDITYNLAFTDMSVDTSANPALASIFRSFTAGITAVKGIATVTNRGVTKSVKLDLGAVTDPTLKQALSQMSTSLENLSMPFPEEAIGAGGRWEVRQTLNSGGVLIFQKTEYVVASLDGPTVVLNAKVEQLAPPQNIVNAELPPGAEIKLEKMTGTGSGTVTVRLDGLVPTSTMESSSFMGMVMMMNGQAEPLSMEMKLKMTLGPGGKK